MSGRLLSVEGKVCLRFASRDSGKPARLVDGRERVRTYVRRRMKPYKKIAVSAQLHKSEVKVGIIHLLSYLLHQT